MEFTQLLGPVFLNARVSEVRVHGVGIIPHVANEDISSAVFDEYVHGNSVCVWCVSALGLAATDTGIQHGYIMHACCVNIIYQLRQLCKVYGVDREVVVSFHVVNVIPLNIL